MDSTLDCTDAWLPIQELPVTTPRQPKCKLTFLGSQFLTYKVKGLDQKTTKDKPSANGIRLHVPYFRLFSQNIFSRKDSFCLSPTGITNISKIHTEMLYLSRINFLSIGIQQLSLGNRDAILTGRAEGKVIFSPYEHIFQHTRVWTRWFWATL